MMNNFSIMSNNLNNLIDFCVFTFIFLFSLQALSIIIENINENIRKCNKNKQKIKALTIQTILESLNKKNCQKKHTPVIKVSDTDDSDSSKNTIYDNSDESDNNPITPRTPHIKPRTPPTPPVPSPKYLNNFQNDLSLTSSEESIEEINSIRKSRRLQKLEPSFSGL